MSKLPGITLEDYKFLKLMSKKEKCHRTFVRESIDFLYKNNKGLLKSMSVFGCGSKTIKLKNGEIRISSAKTGMSTEKIEAIKYFLRIRFKEKSEIYEEKIANRYLANSLQVIQRRV